MDIRSFGTHTPVVGTASVTPAFLTSSQRRTVSDSLGDHIHMVLHMFYIQKSRPRLQVVVALLTDRGRPIQAHETFPVPLWWTLPEKYVSHKAPDCL